VRRELRQFASAPWYENIKRVTSGGGDVTVETDLFRDSDATGPANAICTVIAGPGVDALPGVTGGRVLGSDGGVIKRC